MYVKYLKNLKRLKNMIYKYYVIVKMIVLKNFNGSFNRKISTYVVDKKQKLINTILLNETLCFEYLDINRSKTFRIVSFDAFETRKYGLTGGFCHLRKGYRHFSPENMFSVVNIESGEKLDCASDYFYKLYTNSDEYKSQEILSSIRDELLILEYVCRKDGEVSNLEKSYIYPYLRKRRYFIKPHTDDFLESILTELFHSRLSEQAFKLRFHSLLKHTPTIAIKLSKACAQFTNSLSNDYFEAHKASKYLVDKLEKSKI
jgi:hypothetical protein